MSGVGFTLSFRNETTLTPKQKILPLGTQRHRDDRFKYGFSYKDKKLETLQLGYRSKRGNQEQNMADEKFDALLKAMGEQTQAMRDHHEHIGQELAAAKQASQENQDHITRELVTMKEELAALKDQQVSKEDLAQVVRQQANEMITVMSDLKIMRDQNASFREELTGFKKQLEEPPVMGASTFVAKVFEETTAENNSPSKPEYANMPQPCAHSTPPAGPSGRAATENTSPGSSRTPAPEPSDAPAEPEPNPGLLALQNPQSPQITYVIPPPIGIRQPGTSLQRRTQTSPHSPLHPVRPGFPPQAATPTAVRPPEPRVRLMEYDGKIPWNHYEAHFDVVALVNEWSNETKALYLAAHLRGPALDHYVTLPPIVRYDYNQVREAFRLRFSSANHPSITHIQLRTRVQRSGEDFAGYANDLQRLTALTYANCPEDSRDRIALEYFLAGILDSDIQDRVRDSAPITLHDALQTSIRIEANHRATRASRRSVRAAVASTITDCQEGVANSGERIQQQRTLQPSGNSNELA